MKSFSIRQTDCGITGAHRELDDGIPDALFASSLKEKPHLTLTKAPRNLKLTHNDCGVHVLILHQIAEALALPAYLKSVIPPPKHLIVPLRMDDNDDTVSKFIGKINLMLRNFHLERIAMVNKHASGIRFI